MIPNELAKGESLAAENPRKHFYVLALIFAIVGSVFLGVFFARSLFSLTSSGLQSAVVIIRILLFVIALSAFFAYLSGKRKILRALVVVASATASFLGTSWVAYDDLSTERFGGLIRRVALESEVRNVVAAVFPQVSEKLEEGYWLPIGALHRPPDGLEMGIHDGKPCLRDTYTLFEALNLATRIAVGILPEWP